MDERRNTMTEENIIANELDELTDEENKAVDDAAEKIKNDIMTPNGVWMCKLSKPITYNGVEYSELTFNFGKLTGADALNIEDELTAKGKPVFMNETANAQYLILMAVRACEEHIEADAFNPMSIVDFNRIKNKARLFLLGVAV